MHGPIEFLYMTPPIFSLPGGKWPTSVEAMVVKNLLKCSVTFDFSKHNSFSILSPTEPGLV